MDAGTGGSFLDNSSDSRANCRSTCHVILTDVWKETESVTKRSTAKKT